MNRKAESYGFNYAVKHFTSMLSPSYRGENWDWHREPPPGIETAKATYGAFGESVDAGYREGWAHMLKVYEELAPQLIEKK